MTNARAHFVRHWQRHLALGLAVALLALPLAACETTNSALSSANPDLAVQSLPKPQGRAKLAFAPIVGAPAAVADSLSSGVSAALANQSIPIAKGAGDAPDYTVRGYVVAAPDKAGTKLSYIWDVTDKTGQRAQRFTGEEIVKSAKRAKDPWAQVDAGVIDRIATASASQIAAWVPMKSGGAAPATPAATETQAAAPAPTALGSLGQLFGFGAPATPANASTAAAATATPPAQTAALNPSGPAPGALVTGEIKPPPSAPATTASLPPGSSATTIATVIGAPGDGAQSLARALQANLRNRGVETLSGTVAGAYTVQGKVSMGSPSGGKQTIKIEWQVIDPAGKKKGTVWQNNVVPQGALDGPWGKTADDAAAEAAKGIVELLPKKA